MFEKALWGCLWPLESWCRFIRNVCLILNTNTYFLIFVIFIFIFICLYWNIGWVESCHVCLRPTRALWLMLTLVWPFLEMFGTIFQNRVCFFSLPSFLHYFGGCWFINDFMYSQGSFETFTCSRTGEEIYLRASTALQVALIYRL